MFDLERIKEANRIEEILPEVSGLTLMGRGDQLRTREHDSLVLFLKTQSWKWFSKMDAHGDVISLVQHFLNLDFTAAVEWLANRAGIPVEEAREAAPKLKAARATREALTVISGFLADRLAATAEALEWARGRGWEDELIARENCGYWNGREDRPALIERLNLHGVDVTSNPVKAILRMPAGMFVYAHWENGRCVYLAGRSIYKDAKPPQYNLKESLVGPRRLYYNSAYRYNSRHVVIVEGQADAISLAALGIPAVATAGLSSDATAEEVGSLAKKHKIYIGLDNEDDPRGAAAKAVRRAVGQLAEAVGPATPVIVWPGGKDANDYLLSGAEPAEAERLMAGADIYPIWAAKQLKHIPPLDRDKTTRQIFQIVARLDPFVYAANRQQMAGLLSGGSGPELDRLAKVTRQQMASEAARQTALDKARERWEETEKPTFLEEAAPEAAGVGPVLTSQKLGPELAGQLIKETRDHEGHARSVLALHPNKCAYVPAWDWLVWNGKYWDRTGGRWLVERLIVNTLKTRGHLAVERDMDDLRKATRCDRGNVRNTRDQLESLVIYDTADFDQHIDFLNCQNGVVDLRTGDLHPHDPKWKFTYCLPTDYKPEAISHDWLDFLESVVDGEAETEDGIQERARLMLYLQMAIGYSFTGHTRENKMFYLHGPTRSGKGTFIGTITEVMGKPLASGIEFNTLMHDDKQDAQNFDLAGLFPCRMVTASESGKYQRLNAEKIKQITGEDEIRCCFKHKDHFTYKPKYKIWLQSNNPLNLDVYDDAAWTRVDIIEFPNSYANKEDKGLKARLVTAENLEGVLAWAVEGAMMWYSLGTGGLKAPALVANATRKQREDQDYIQMFLDECAEEVDLLNDSLFEPVSDLHSRYKAWSKEGGRGFMQMRAFSLAMKAKGFEADRRRIDGKLYRGYAGIRLQNISKGAYKGLFD